MPGPCLWKVPQIYLFSGDIIIFWKQETVGCLAARISFSPGLDLHCFCLENSKTINPFFFSWIGFALHVSGEFQNDQSFLLLLDWICIACVWRIPKRSILSCPIFRPCSMLIVIAWMCAFGFCFL
jgi:hypothetical protein